ncbi:MAG: ABC transporter permease [Bacteroidota bacterium]
MKPNEQHPPRWATRFLRWYCKSSLIEDLEGDLNEYFERNLKSKGARRARLIYVIDVFKFLRLYTLRKPEFINLLINWIMIGSYIKTSGRSIVRNKLFSAINIVGLAISMLVGLIMIGTLLDMYSYDKFHEKHDRIYRVISRYEYLGNKDDQFNATNSLRTAKSIKETFPGQEDVAILRRGLDGDFQVGDKIIPLKGFWSNEALFNVFSFKLLQGNPATALKDPFSVVLTEESIKKLFGNENALGKTIILNKDREYTITGITENVPKLSHIKFDVLASLSGREITEKDNANEMAWDNVWNAWVYVLLPDDANLASFQVNLNELSKKEDPSVKNTHIELALQPLDKIMIGESMNNQISSVMGSALLWIFGGLSFVVLLSACFNYTNLSIARSLKRSREVGIRKVIGAMKGHVIGQFVVEAIIISLLSLIAAFVLFLLIKPYFLTMHSDLQELLILDLKPILIGYFILFAIFVGVAAGFFPALFFARINAIQALKNTSTVRLFRKVNMRKALVVFQYCISIMLITGTLIIYKQYKHFLAFDLGYSTENILNIQLQGNKAELLKKELNELPEIKLISKSALITSVGSMYGTIMKNPNNPEDSAGVRFNYVDENYIPLHEHHLLAGHNFLPKSDSAKETEVIVNQQVLKRFNIADQDPAKAIGESVKIDRIELQIIGVMKDFQYGRANNASGEKVVLRYSNHEFDYLNVKILSSDLHATYAKINAIWREIDSVHPLEAKFYDDEIEQAFSGLSASIKLAGALAFLAICIASLGLLGMVVFTTETRIKEISIRKVMGASEGKLVYLLGKGFYILLTIAILIALPVTYLLFDKVFFPNLANHAPLSLVDGLIGVIAVIGIASIMIGSQTLKVARSNPAEVLKNE